MPALISPPDEKVLRHLWTKGPQTAARVGADQGTVRRLAEQGLISEVPAASAKGKPRIGLTERGREVASELAPASPKTIDLFRALVALREEVRTLRALLAPSPPPAPASATVSPAAAGTGATLDLTREIRSAVEELGQRERLGGLVSLPALRKHLGHLAIPRPELDAALLAAERAYVIDLKIANDRAAVSDASEGIVVDGRGLLYFVVAR